jgi:uncharacterized protein YkwD
MTRASLTALISIVALAALALAPAAIAAPEQRPGVGKSIVAAQPQEVAQSSSLVAPTSECPGQNSLTAPADAQEQAMRCMVDYARSAVGLSPLSEALDLDASATAKAADVLSCDSFSHDACGRDFTYWMRAVGYIAPNACWHTGENLAWGAESYGTVRSIFQAWMRSPAHRRNILGTYDQVGVSLQIGDLGGQPGIHVWAQHFGSHCDPEQAG